MLDTKPPTPILKPSAAIRRVRCSIPALSLELKSLLLRLAHRAYRVGSITPTSPHRQMQQRHHLVSVTRGARALHLGLEMSMNKARVCLHAVADRITYAAKYTACTSCEGRSSSGAILSERYFGGAT